MKLGEKLQAFIPFTKGKVDVEKVANSIISGVDKGIYTKEERIDDDMASLAAFREWQTTTLAENSIRSRARRTLAHWVVAVFLLQGIFASGIYWFNPEYSEFVFEVVLDLGSYVRTIFLFYFGSHVARTLINPVTRKEATGRLKRLLKKEERKQEKSEN